MRLETVYQISVDSYMRRRIVWIIFVTFSSEQRGVHAHLLLFCLVLLTLVYVKCRAAVVRFVSSARSVHFLRQGEWASRSRCPFVILPCFRWLHLIIEYVDTVWSKKFRQNAPWYAKYALLRAFEKCCVSSDCVTGCCLSVFVSLGAEVPLSIEASTSQLALENGRLVAESTRDCLPSDKTMVIMLISAAKGR